MSVLARADVAMREGFRVLVAVFLCCLSFFGIFASFGMASAAAIDPQAATRDLDEPSRASAALLEQERRIEEEARREGGEQAAGNVDLSRAFVPVERLDVQGYEGMDATHVQKLVPEASKKIVNVRQLSKQIQMMNEGGAMKLAATFSRDEEGKVVLSIQSEGRQEQQVSVNVSNTGNEYSGN